MKKYKYEIKIDLDGHGIIEYEYDTVSLNNAIKLFYNDTCSSGCFIDKIIYIKCNGKIIKR